jgi:hypothetical protein
VIPLKSKFSNSVRLLNIYKNSSFGMVLTFEVTITLDSQRYIYKGSVFIIDIRI